MLRITGNNEQLMIRELPIVQWGFAFFVSIALILGIYFMFSLEDLSFSWIAPSLTMSIAAGILLFNLFTNPSTTIRINRPGKTISIRKQSLINYTFNVYSFDEIAGLISVDEIASAEWQKSYQLNLRLKSGGNVKLSTSSDYQKGQFFEAADFMNSYIFDTSKQISAKPGVLGDD
jgi:hypothetical protein